MYSNDRSKHRAASAQATRRQRRRRELFGWELLEERRFMDGKNFALLKADAFALSQLPYQPPVIEAIAALDPPDDGELTSVGMTYQEKNAITTKNFSDQYGACLKPQVRAGANQKSMQVFTDNDLNSVYDERTFTEASPDYSSPVIKPPVTLVDIPASGRVLSQITMCANAGAAGFPQVFTLGAEGYARFNGFPPQTVGASWRVATNNIFGVGGTENFPAIKAVYSRILTTGKLELLALVDAEAFTGALSILVSPGTETTLDVDAIYYPRHDVKAAQSPETAFVAYSSMMFKDERDTPSITSDEAHDTDTFVVGLDLNGDGIADKLVTSTIDLPALGSDTSVTRFEEIYGGRPVFFTLDNRDRDPTHYSTYADANYASRASYSVEILKSDVPLGMHMFEHGPDKEYGDNLVFAATIKGDLHKATSVTDGVQVVTRHRSFTPTDSNADGVTDRVSGILGSRAFENIQYQRAEETLNVPAQFATIQAAIDAADPGDTILVAPGTYVENIAIEGKAVNLVGAGAGQTFLKGVDASNKPTVRFSNVDQTAKLSGFTITNGYSWGDGAGGGVDIADASPTVEYNEITGNSSRVVGAGISIHGANANAVIRNNDIHDNFSRTTPGSYEGSGAGIYVGGNAKADIRDNKIRANRAWAKGGGIFAGPIYAGGMVLGPAASVVIERNVVQGNSGDFEGGIVVSQIPASGKAEIRNNLVLSNTSGIASGAGITVWNSNALVVNNTVAGNFGGQPANAGIRFDSLSRGDVRNNIVYGNDEYGIDAPSTVKVAYNDVYMHSKSSYSGGATSGIGGIAVDPLFVNAATGDYRLKSGSIAINAGDPSVTYLDKDGTRNDMGAFGGQLQIAGPLERDRFVASVGRNATDQGQNDDMRGLAVAADGRVYSGGSFSSAGDEGNNPGNADFFVESRAPDGTLLWRNTFAGTGDERLKALRTDAAGNVYVLFNTNSTGLDVDPSPNASRLVSTSGSYDHFVARLSPAGALEWVVQIGGPTGVWDRGADLFVSGNRLVVTGTIGGTVDFDRSATYADNRDLASSRGSGDAYVASYDLSGRFQWVWTAGGPGQFEGGTAVAIDSLGATYAGVRFEAGADFTGDGIADVFGTGMALVKLEATGKRVWYQPVLGPGFQIYDGIAVTADNKVLAVGQFQGSVDFDPSATKSDRRASVNSSFDGFYQSFDSNGNYLFTKTVGTWGQDAIRDVAIAPNGQIALVGRFGGDPDFAPGLDLDGDRDLVRSARTADGSWTTDGFVVLLDASGGFSQVLSVSGSGENEVSQVAYDSFGRLHVSGSYSQTATVFDGERTRTLTSSGGLDGFIIKTVPSTLSTDIRVISAAANASNGVTVTYDIIGPSSAAGFDLTVYRSGDSHFDSGDLQLGQPLPIRSAVDLTPGRHVKSFVLGANAGQIPVPGLGTSETPDDYHLLFIADVLNLVAEPDPDPIGSNNTVGMTGVYHPLTGPVFVHGGMGNDSLSIPTGDSLVFNSTTIAFTPGTVTEFRVRLSGGDDAVTPAAAIVKPISMFGGNGADRLTSSAGNDLMVGGTGDDSYLFDADGQLGNDTIADYSGADLLDFSSTTTQPIVLNLGTTALQAINSFSRLTLVNSIMIEGVIGGSQSDTIYGNDLPNFIIGGPGNDNLWGRAGNDLLVGGAGIDSLYGEAGDDVLVGGTTIYDTNTLALRTLLSEWNAPDSYDTKLGRLRRGEPGYLLLAKSTAMNDNAVDRLLGGDGQDWFFLALGEAAADRATNELIDVV